MASSTEEQDVTVKTSIAREFRITTTLLLLLALTIIVSVTIGVTQELITSISSESAQLYSEKIASTMATQIASELALVQKAAKSQAVIDWFLEEESKKKQAEAGKELSDILSLLKSHNIYIGTERLRKEYLLLEGMNFENVNSHDDITENYFDDEWFFDAMESENSYRLNLDENQIMDVKMVWINHKVLDNGEPVGVLSTGLNAIAVLDSLLSRYDTSKVRLLIINNEGVVQIDSSRQDESGVGDALVYREHYRVADEVSDLEFTRDLEAHLASVDGAFKDGSRSVLTKLSAGEYAYATIAPISGTDWSSVILYDSSALFSYKQLLPLLIAAVAILLAYAIITMNRSYNLLLKPIDMLVRSLKVSDNGKIEIYGLERDDEVGLLAGTIDDMKSRLDSYSSDLEMEVAERSADLQKAYEHVIEQNDLILSSVEYAGKIQKSALPPQGKLESFFPDSSVVWKPRDTVGGDIYWFRRFPQGALLCVCDCTGHGTSGALLTMLVASAIEAIVHDITCADTANVIWELENKLDRMLDGSAQIKKRDMVKDGCDIAVIFIANDGSMDVSSAHMRVLISRGGELTRIRGQNIHVGEGKISSRDEVAVTHIPSSPDTKVFVATDGLYDQVGEKTGIPFGYKATEVIITKYHKLALSEITDKVLDAFETHRGNESRRDDMEIIAFEPPCMD